MRRAVYICRLSTSWQVRGVSTCKYSDLLLSDGKNILNNFRGEGVMGGSNNSDELI